MATSPREGPPLNPPDDVGFNPYYKWLGIRGGIAPYDYYLMLGLSAFEDDLDVIAAAADRQMAHVRTYQTGEHADASQRILNELAKAKVTLLNPDRKSQYDDQLYNKTPAAPPTAVWETPAPPLQAMSVGANSAPSRGIDPQETESCETSHPSEQGRQRQSLHIWIVLGIACSALIALIVIAINKRPSDRPGTDGSEPLSDAVAQVDPHSGLGPDPDNGVDNGNHSNRTNGGESDLPDVQANAPDEAAPTPEEIELAELAAARARVAEAIRRDEARQEAARAAAEAEEEAEAAAEAETAAQVARTEFRRIAWEKYRELSIRYSDSNIDELLDAAQSEQDPATRAGIAFVAVEHALAADDLVKMNSAMNIVTSPSAEHGYAGINPYEAIQGEEQILEGGNFGRCEPIARLALTQELIKNTWVAYEHSDYALAERLIARAYECARGLNATNVARGNSPEERSTASERLRAIRGALLDAKERTERFSELSEAADNGSALSAALLGIEQEGDWKDALDHLSDSDVAEIANAATLDKTNPESPTDLLAAAEAWRAAAASDFENKNHWNDRSAALLARAIEAASTQGLDGVAALEFDNDASALAGILTSAGVRLDSPAGRQGYVVNGNGQGIDAPPAGIGGIDNPGPEGRDPLARERERPAGNNEEAPNQNLAELIDRFTRYRRPEDNYRRGDPALIPVLAAAGPVAILPLIEAVKENSDIRQSVGKIFFQMGPDAAPHLIEAVRRDYCWSSRMTFHSALLEGGTDSVPLIHVIMHDRDSRIRALALYALQSIDIASIETLPDGFVSHLIVLLDDPDTDVSGKVPSALGKLVQHADVVVPVLIRLLSDVRYADIAHNSVGPLGRLATKLREDDPQRERAAGTLLAAITNHPDSSVRAYSAYYLSQLVESEPAVIAALRRATGDPVEFVRKYAREALYRLGSAPSDEVSETGLADQAPLDLVHILIGEDRTASTAACAELITREPDRELFNAFIQVIRADNNNRYWNSVAEIIAAWDQEITLPQLESFARDEHPRVRRAAALAFGTMNLESIPECVPALCQDREEWVRATMYQSLALMSEQAAPDMIAEIVPLLIAGLNDEAVQKARGYWSEVASALADIGPGHPAVVPALIDLMKNAGDESIRERAANKLVDLARLLREDHEDIERIVASILEAIRREPNSRTRRYFIMYLGYMGARAESALPTLREAVNDPFEEVSKAATEAIARIEDAD